MITIDVNMSVRQKPDSDPIAYGREAGDLDASFSIELEEAL